MERLELLKTDLYVEFESLDRASKRTKIASDYSKKG